MVQKLTLRKDDVLIFKITSTTSTSPWSEPPPPSNRWWSASAMAWWWRSDLASQVMLRTEVVSAGGWWNTCFVPGECSPGVIMQWLVLCEPILRQGSVPLVCSLFKQPIVKYGMVCDKHVLALLCSHLCLMLWSPVCCNATV
jgi:hypothetical protein